VTKQSLKRLPPAERAKEWEARHEWGGERVYRLVLDLGGFYVKSAQVLASKFGVQILQSSGPLASIWVCKVPSLRSPAADSHVVALLHDLHLAACTDSTVELRCERSCVLSQGCRSSCQGRVIALSSCVTCVTCMTCVPCTRQSVQTVLESLGERLFVLSL